MCRRTCKFYRTSEMHSGVKSVLVSSWIHLSVFSPFFVFLQNSNLISRWNRNYWRVKDITDSRPRKLIVMDHTVTLCANKSGDSKSEPLIGKYISRDLTSIPCYAPFCDHPKIFEFSIRCFCNDDQFFWNFLKRRICKNSITRDVHRKMTKRIVSKTTKNAKYTN